MKHMRVFAAAATVFTLISVCISASDATYLSIADLQPESAAWQETFTLRTGEAITLPIHIPPVQAFPVLETARIGEMTPHAADVTVISVDAEGIVLEKRTSDTSFCYGWGEPYYEPTAYAQAEYSPLTAQEAQAFLRDIVLQYQDQLGPFDLLAQPVLAASREYQVIRENGEKAGIDRTRPVTEMGHYSIWFYQTFHGIPRLESAILGEQAVRNIAVKPPLGEIYGNVSSENDYSLVVFAGKETGIREADVPLLSFDAVRAQIEALLEEGYLRDIYDIRLGYGVMEDPQAPGEIYLLTPIWRIRGDVYDRPGAPDNPISAEALAMNRQGIGGGGVLNIDAQTGRVVTDGPRNFLTWDQVQ